MTDIDPTQGHWRIFFTGLVIIFGAITHASANYKIARETNNTKFTWVDFLILFLIASFAGLIFGFVSAWFFPDKVIIQYICSGMGSFLGIVGINAFSQALLEVVLNKLKK